MTKRQKAPTTAIGYIRVSTEGQRESGQSLEAQAGRIREWAAMNGYSVTFIHEDVASAMHKSLQNRPGLRDTIAMARATGASIIVTSLDRLFRSSGEAEGFVRTSGAKVISIATGGPLRAAVVLSQTADAERAGKLISAKTKSGLELKKLSGMTLGSPADKRVAAKASVLVRKMKASEVVDHIRRFLQADRSRAMKKVPALVRELNAAGIRTGWNRMWTDAALRRPLSLALEQLKGHDQMDAEEDLGPFAENRIPDVAGSVATAKNKPVEDSEIHYKTNANYGRF